MSDFDPAFDKEFKRLYRELCETTRAYHDRIDDLCVREEKRLTEELRTCPIPVGTRVKNPYEGVSGVITEALVDVSVDHDEDSPKMGPDAVSIARARWVYVVQQDDERWPAVRMTSFYVLESEQLSLLSDNREETKTRWHCSEWFCRQPGDFLNDVYDER